ncbi:hypothetical protein INT46_002152 [Mucor plumbeus]|uniref:Reverse transcriptase zinc-binding domain-containing protein n=1 Tax=Mucor plumbeus TaxID=97098 RepID=A0A8H7QN46_9FUNG|nr:hypothetical protein INT46_002152 [Mucor plumbeus]
MANTLDFLLLPVISTITAASVYRPCRGSKLHNVKVSDLFNYCSMGHFLLPKVPTELSIEFKYIGAIFHKHIRTGSANFEPFFRRCLQPSALNFFAPTDRATIQLSLNFTAFLNNLSVHSPAMQVEFSKHQVKSFRRMLVNATMHRVRSSLAPSAAAWSRFWALSLTFVQRNVPLRLLHQKVNTRLQMSIYNSELYQANCLFCLQDSVIIPHFFFFCPIKSSFWIQLIDEFLWPGITIQEIQAALTTLNFERISVKPFCPYAPIVILIIAISELWKSRWRFVVDQIPFHPNIVVSATSAALKKRFAEDHLSDFQ